MTKGSETGRVEPSNAKFSLGPADKDPSLGDWALLDLVALAEVGNEISITLTIGGGMLTGLMIGANTFFKEMAQLIAGAGAHGAAAGSTISALETSWTHLAGRYAWPEDSHDWAPNIDGFIHMRDARFLSFGIATMPTLPLWRGRAIEVAGWSLGSA